MATLICRHLKKRTEWTVEVGEGPFTLGYSTRAQAPLPDPSLDPIEVRVTPEDDVHILRDVAEKNRVRLGEAVTRECPLRDGDVFQVGAILVRFVTGPESAAGAAGAQVRLSTSHLRPEAFDVQVPGLEPSQLDAPVPDSAPTTLRVPATLRWFLVATVVAIGFGLGLVYTGPTEAGRTTSLEAVRPLLSPPEEPASTPTVAAGAAPRGIGEGVAGPGAPRTDAGSAYVGGAPGGVTAPTLQPPASSREGLAAALGDLRKRLEKPGTDEARSSEAAASQAAVARAPAAPAIFAPPKDSPEASRRRLFRIFLEVARRSPTPAEEAELMARPHEERWAAAREAARREAIAAPWERGVGAAQPELLAAILGRPPTKAEEEELDELVTRERPVAYWALLHPDAARPTLLRARDSMQCARSWIVDLLGRAPASPAEEEVVRVALEEEAGLVTVARTLVHAGWAGLSPPLTLQGWQERAFRFLLHAPTLREAAAVERILEPLAPGERWSALLTALALHPDHAKY